MKIGIRILGVIAAMVFLTGCQTTAKDAWTNVIRNCTNDDSVASRDVVYLGPSNNIGVGAAWRTKRDGYGLSQLPANIGLPQTCVNLGTWSSCLGTSSKTFSLDASADAVLSQISGTAGMGSQLNRAKTVRVHADTWRNQQLIEQEFSTWVDSLPTNHPYKQLLTRQDIVVAYRAIEIRGFSAELEFDAKTAIDVRGKIDTQVLSSVVGDVGAKLDLEWTRENTLKISAADPFYIVNYLAKYYPGRGVGRGGYLQSVPAQESPALAFEVK